jgi:hypothetical protein
MNYANATQYTILCSTDVRRSHSKKNKVKSETSEASEGPEIGVSLDPTDSGCFRRGIRAICILCPNSFCNLHIHLTSITDMR